MALMMSPISLLFCSGHSEGTTTGPMGDLGGRRERTTSLRNSRMGWSAPDRACRSPSYLACSSPAIGTLLLLLLILVRDLLFPGLAAKREAKIIL